MAVNYYYVRVRITSYSAELHYALLHYSGARESCSRARRKGASFEWAMKNTFSVQSCFSRVLVVF